MFQNYKSYFLDYDPQKLQALTVLADVCCPIAFLFWSTCFVVFFGIPPASQYTPFMPANQKLAEESPSAPPSLSTIAIDIPAPLPNP